MYVYWPSWIKIPSDDCKIDPLDQWPSRQMTLWPMTFFATGTYEQWVSQLNDMLQQQYSHHKLQLQRASQLGPPCLDSNTGTQTWLINSFFLMFTQLLGSLDSVLDPMISEHRCVQREGFHSSSSHCRKNFYIKQTYWSMEWHHYIFTVLRMEISLCTFFYSNLYSIYKHCNIPAYLYCKLQSYWFMPLEFNWLV